jgi:hypothetical protein
MTRVEIFDFANITANVKKNVFLQQGDQVSLLKNRPHCSPIHFLSNLIHNFYLGKQEPKSLGYLCDIWKTAQIKLCIAQFAQSGHPVLHLLIEFRVILFIGLDDKIVTARKKNILFLCPKGDIFFNFIFIRSVWRWLATFLPLFGKETSELYKLSVFLSGPSLLSFLYIYLSGCAFIYLSCRCASIPLQFFCPALMQSATGCPGWANFRILGDCFLWAVLLKIAQVAQINGPLFPL